MTGPREPAADAGRRSPRSGPGPTRRPRGRRRAAEATPHAACGPAHAPDRAALARSVHWRGRPRPDSTRPGPGPCTQVRRVGPRARSRPGTLEHQLLAVALFPVTGNPRTPYRVRPLMILLVVVATKLGLLAARRHVSELDRGGSGGRHPARCGSCSASLARPLSPICLL